MPRFATLALAATLASSASIAAPALAQADTAAEFEARYAALRTAMEARDAAATGAILAPEYTMTDLRGETRKGADMLARMQKMAARAPDAARKIETKVLSATVVGDRATVEQQLVGGARRTGDDGKEHTMEMVMASTDTWARRGEAWLLVSSVQTGMTVKRDGEVFFHEGK
ncbi:uncharacterized protein DUF4440 [Novosphingobium kunmingense]|uniref:Uncharacterized protein DUF4440 n=1 Tax=Novosphingobium kunmingense TaxID=1211806 RepID=A0A2N0HKH4_9SPHN|nr:nuclear transport factor 2 family protein [Novosphingobium kunmingense]PKB19453.1 uncharacterized protein DUF4440 [Novosphingobium kunmingense]